MPSYNFPTYLKFGRHLVGEVNYTIAKTLTDVTDHVYAVASFGLAWNGTLGTLETSIDALSFSLSTHPNPAEYTGTAADDATVGTIAWTDPTNAEGNASNYATATLLATEVSHYLKCTNFGFAIPSTATIIGIKVDATTTGSTGNINDRSVKIVKGGTISGTDLAVSTSWSGGSRDWGSSGTELWGLSWTPSDVNASTFGVAISADNLSATYEARILAVKITLYYSFPVTRKWEINPQDLGWETLSSEVLTWVAGGTLTDVEYEEVKSSGFTNAKVPFTVRLSFTAQGTSTITVTNLSTTACFMRAIGATE